MIINIPCLVGLETLTTYWMHADNVRDKLCLPDLNIEVSLAQKNEHIQLERPKADFMLFTQQELLKLHQVFSHPANDKLPNLLWLSSPPEVDAITAFVLNNIVKHCKNCQHRVPSIIIFKPTVPTEDKLVFGDEISVGLMFLNRKDVLHVDDTATIFSKVTILDAHEGNYGQSTVGVWIALLKYFRNIYTGYPNRARSDQSSIFTSKNGNIYRIVL